MKKRIITVILMVAIMLAPDASAHVLIADTTSSKGAILHIIPDDDPVAGETATLFFDTQAQLLKATGSSIELAITNGSGETTTLPMKVDGTLATVDYVFPAQGVYELDFSVRTGTESFTFTQSQRVSRGTAASALDRPTYPWAEMLIITSGISLLLLAVIGFNRRDAIKAQSKL